jgi:hypothetical protein
MRTLGCSLKADSFWFFDLTEDLGIGTIRVEVSNLWLILHTQTAASTLTSQHFEFEGVVSDLPLH